MPKATEKTRLLREENKPQYVFEMNCAKERKLRIKQFQCCLCVIFIFIVVVTLVVTVSYSINSSSDNNNSPINSTTNLISSIEPVLRLMSNSWPLPDKNNVAIKYNNKTEWDFAISAGEEALNTKNLIEQKISPLPIDSPSYKHQKVTATSKKARLLSQMGYIEEFATKYLKNKLNESLEVCFKNNYCSQNQIECNIFQKYRTFNGSCNNLKYPQNFGMAYTQFRRALPPNYADGISAPRVAQDGSPLPSARTVSLTVHRPYYKDDPKFSVMLAVWGQFLDHDITSTASSQGANGSTISCCSTNKVLHPECFPVNLDKSDPFAKYNVTCMEFIRSAPAPTCCLGARQQINQMTAFIDGSVIYGIDENVVKKLRRMEGGEMKMYLTKDNRTLLPLSDDLTDGCNREEQQKNGKYCFLTGDARGNENLHLTSMHLIWARNHNFIAKNLSLLNPHWGDERIFQETRRILIAQMQHITYKEFLPILLGSKLMEKFDLNPNKSHYFTKYNESIDPSIANNFATAAFRFAHTIIPGLMKLLANDTSSPEFIQLHKMLFDPFKLYQPGELDRALRGAMDTSIEASDTFFSNELKQHLFESQNSDKSKKCGLDLVSLNIQRGRDHGLVGYNSWRKHCGLRKVQTFHQLLRDIDGDSLKNIELIYRNVNDIDLYTGALSEKPIKGSILGPTLTCLILDQFIRIKFGDRFWYETPKFPQAFALSQLNEIRKISLARIICDNSDNVEYVQSLVMEKVRKDNKIVPCSEIPFINLNLWKEEIDVMKMSNNLMSIRIQPEG